MNKYDRQIRLWSATGQKALESAHILVLGVKTSTTEMVKCLALAGLKRITLCDRRLVNNADIHSNFFLQPADLGSPIIPPLLASLAELNPDILMDSVTSPNFNDYDVVVVANATSQQLEQLYAANPINIVDVTSFGFYGKLRVFYPNYTSFDTHPVSLVDLRFGNNVWPELQAYFDSFDLDNLSSYDHQAVPFPVILSKLGSPVPTNLAEKRALKQKILSQAGPDDENWREAAALSYHLWSSITPASYQELFAKADTHKGEFWTLVKALRDFVDETGVPPLSGVLPDMKTDTKNYTQLKRIYRDKAQKDVAKLSLLVKNHTTEEISSETIKSFCKNARHLLAVEGMSPATNTASIKGFQADEYDDESLQKVQFRDIFNALELGCQEVEFWPSTANTAALLREKMGAQQNQVVINELTRSGGAELNAISSMMGGFAAQEVTKLILKHYVPLQHTLVYDGTSSNSACF